ncbi:MAG: hypothetical protein WAO55_13765 [Candidatus Manganitrophaceae bacterium]
MRNLSDSASFGAQLSCPSSSRFLSATAWFLPTGDLTVRIDQDTDLNGTAEDPYTVPFGVSGICGNGVIACDPGQWTNCNSYKWSANTAGRASLRLAPMTELGGCYCLNASCGNPLASNLPKALKDLGGGAVGAVQSNNPKYAVTEVRVEGPSIGYYGQNAAACSSVPASGGSTTPEQYFGNPGIISSDAQVEVMTQSGNPNSYYSLITNSPAAQKTATDVKQCKIDRAVSIATATSFCQDPPPDGTIASRDTTTYFKVFAGTNRSRNDCSCSNVTGYCSPPAASVTAAPPPGAVFLGSSAENFRDRGSQKGHDDCTYDDYDYYSVCTRTTDVLNESVTNACSAVESDPKCRLRDETADVIETYLNFQPTGLTPLPSCRGISGETQAHSVCRDWWGKRRTYLCNIGEEGYDFSDIQKRMGTITTTADDETTSFYYQDMRKDNSGNWISHGNTINLPKRDPLSKCQSACKTRKPIADTQAGVSGNTSQFRTSTGSYEFFVKSCVSNACPLDPGEELVKSCQCMNEFSEAAAMMQILAEAGRDTICSSGVRR